MPSSPGYIPGPLIIPNCLLFRLRWQLSNGKNISNDFHALWTGGGPPSPTWPEDVFDGILASGAWTSLQAYMPTTVSLLGMDMKDLRFANQPFITSSTAADFGTSIEDALPEGVSLVVTLRTGLAGRANRGRVYLAGFAANGLDANGHAVVGLGNACKALVDEVNTQFGAIGMTLAVAGRAHDAYTSPATGNLVPAAAAHCDAVTGTVMEDLVFDSQRRRK